MQTKLEISRGPRGFLLHLPSGRTLNVSADESGARCIERILRDADERAHYDSSGYIGQFPTQHILDIWARGQKTQSELAQQREAMDQKAKEIKARKAKEKREATEREWADRGIDINAVEFKL